MTTVIDALAFLQIFRAAMLLTTAVWAVVKSGSAPWVDPNWHNEAAREVARIPLVRAFRGFFNWAAILLAILVLID